MEDFPAVFPCFSKDLDSFLWDTICTKGNKRGRYWSHNCSYVFSLIFPLRNSVLTALLEMTISMSIDFLTLFNEPLLKTGYFLCHFTMCIIRV